MIPFNVTGRHTNQNDVEFLHLKKILDDLEKVGFYVTANGHCVSTSEVLKNILYEKGFSCYLMECKVLVQYLTPPFMYHAIGYDTHNARPNTIDTHVILVTQTKTPYIIDASIAGRLPKTNLYVLSSLHADWKELDLFNIDTDLVKVIYEQKKEYKLPPLYQQSILERLKANIEIKKELKQLKILNLIGITVSIFALINVILNILGIYK